MSTEYNTGWEINCPYPWLDEKNSCCFPSGPLYAPEGWLSCSELILLLVVSLHKNQHFQILI
jgi:hypothetical protein